MATLKIAVTGGIGSGKSTVTEILKDLGYKTFSCDKIAHALYKKDFVKEILVKEFGEEILNSHGRVCRRRLGLTVFKDKEKLKKLNSLTHPIIIDELYKKIDAVKGVAIAEVPLLFECKMENNFDKVLVVTRPLEDRINAVISRDKTNKEKVLDRIKNQIDYENLKNDNHIIISNDASLENLKASVKAVIEKIIEEKN